VIDDLGTQALDAQARADLLELIEARSDGKSTIVTSQLPISIWHDFLSGGNKTVADATLDRLVSDCVKVILKGESIRHKKGAKFAENPQHADLFGHSINP
jgi:DNA replication protein DnaC